MPSRKRLPGRRTHEIAEVEHWGQKLTLGIGRVHDHTPIVELFINVEKTGTQIETMLRDSAVLISIALQYGTSLRAMRDAISRSSDGSPLGPVGRILDSLLTGDKNDLDE